MEPSYGSLHRIKCMTFQRSSKKFVTLFVLAASLVGAAPKTKPLPKHHPKGLVRHAATDAASVTKTGYKGAKAVVVNVARAIY